MEIFFQTGKYKCRHYHAIFTKEGPNTSSCPSVLSLRLFFFRSKKILQQQQTNAQTHTKSPLNSQVSTLRERKNPEQSHKKSSSFFLHFIFFFFIIGEWKWEKVVACTIPAAKEERIYLKLVGFSSSSSSSLHTSVFRFVVKEGKGEKRNRGTRIFRFLSSSTNCSIDKVYFLSITTWVWSFFMFRGNGIGDKYCFCYGAMFINGETDCWLLCNCLCFGLWSCFGAFPSLVLGSIPLICIWFLLDYVLVGVYNCCLSGCFFFC